MKRRKALKQLGIGLAGGMVLPPWLSACKKDDAGPEIDYDGTIGIIGAGVAGLYAADILNSKGINVTVYEATEQLGGRVRTLRNQSEDAHPNKNKLGTDYPVEIGADLIFGTDGPLGKIVSDYHLPTVNISEDTTPHFIMDNLAKSEVDWGADADYIAAQNFLNSTLGSLSGSGLSVQQAIQGAGISTRAQAMLNGQIGNFYGSSNDEMGVGSLAEGLGMITHDRIILSPKANSLQDLFISRFVFIQPRVKLSTPIQSVAYGGEKVTLTDEANNQYEHNKVIITVPASILKNGSINFSPSLPALKTSALAKIGMGATMRVILDFKKNFWGEAVGFLWGGVDGPQYFNTGVGRGEFSRTLSVTINGAKAEELSADTETVLVDKLIAELDLIYGGQATDFIRFDIDDPTKRIFIRQDWSTQPYFLGGYSYPMTGATNNDRVNLGLPVNDKLYFAGEATDINGDWGNINGALSSAERASEEIVLSILNP